MRDLTAAVETEIQAVHIAPFLMGEFEFDSATLRLWTGFGNITVFGNSFTGGGEMIGITDFKESGQIQADNITCTLTGIDSTLIANALLEPYQNRGATIWMGLMDSSGVVIPDPFPLYSGRMDVMFINEGPETSEIALTIESRLVALDKSKESRYTDAEQRLRNPLDDSLSLTNDIQNRSVFFGQA